jgi:ADP-ribose pyrophosphatase
MKVLFFEKLTNHSWLNLFKLHYTDKNNATRTWMLASRSKEPKAIARQTDRPDAVVIMAQHLTTGKIVLTREYRVTLGDVEYGFPAGLIDPGETIPEATERELKEETGLDMIRFLRISPTVYSSAGMTDESVVMVYIECDGHPSTAHNQASESIEVMLVSEDEAGALCQNPDLKFDAKAWLALSAFARFGFPY